MQNTVKAQHHQRQRATQNKTKEFTMRFSSKYTYPKRNMNRCNQKNQKLNAIMSSAKAIQRSIISTATLGLLFASRTTTTVSASNTTTTTPPSLSPSFFPSTPKNLQPASDLLTVDTISMTLTGVTPLTADEIQWFEEKTEGYIIHYYNVEISACNSCLQKDFDIHKVQIDVAEQDPPYTEEMAAEDTTNDTNQDGADGTDGADETAAGGNDRNRQRIRRRNTLANMNNILDVTIQIDDEKITTSSGNNNHPKRNLNTSSVNKVTLTYSQKTSYQKVNPNIPDPIIYDIVKEPFNNISKRRRFKEFIKAPSNVPEVFKSLSLVTAPSITMKTKSIFGIGVIAAISAGGLIFLVLSIFLIYRVTRHRKRKLDHNINGGSYDVEMQEQSRARNGLHPNPNMHHQNKHPSQLHLSEGLKDEVSTMVDPAQQYGVFDSGGKSLNGYNANGARYVFSCLLLYACVPRSVLLCM